MKISLICVTTVLVIALGLYAFNKSHDQSDKETIEAQIAKLPPVSKDYKSPEGAILSLEDAYRKRDIEAAVASKDFITEARLMLKQLNNQYTDDPKVLAETAETLELSFRKFTKQSWPDFNGIQSHFIKREQYQDKIVVVTEICRFPDGGFSKQRILVTETENGWRVLNVID